MFEKIFRSLQSLGFKPMEAEVYVDLCRHPDSTAYAVAQSIRKNRANIYKSLETLQQKQAVIASSGNSIKWRAVPYNELLNRIEAAHKERTSELRSLMAQLSPAKGTPNVYHFEQPDIVFSKTSEMIRNARELILLDAFPALLEMFRTDIIQAANSGVHVALRTYAHFRPVQGVQAFLSEDTGLTKSWNSAWLNLIVDGSEFVLSNLSADSSKVHHAYWSDDAYMSVVYGSSLISEMTLGAFIANGETSPVTGQQLIKTFTDLNERLRHTAKYQQLKSV